MGYRLGYRFIRALVRILLRLFYARIEVVGAEHVPPSGALVVAANHHNSVVDAMLLVAVMPRPLRSLANAPLFRNPLLGPLLRAAGALPVHRRKESGDDPTKNAALFAATTATLHGGGAILIFPEGRTQPEPMLQEVRTGTARMLLAAAEGHPPATLLPVGLVYQQPGTFREGRALVLIGAPVAVSDCLQGDAPAVRMLTDRLADAIRAQIVEADDRQTLRLLELVEELLRANGAGFRVPGPGATRAEGDDVAAPGTRQPAPRDGAAPPDQTARLAWLQRAVRIYKALRDSAPDRVSALREQLEAFDAELQRAGVAAVQLSREYTAATVVRFALREGLALLVGAPLALCGIVAHILPYQLTAAAVRLIPHTDEEDATDKIVAGLVFFPLAWAAETWGVYLMGGRWAAILFLAALLPTGFFALAWRERFERVGREARAFIRYLRDRDLPRRLRRRRQELAAELAALATVAESLEEERA